MQPFTVVVDSGSADLWVPNTNACSAKDLQPSCEAYGTYNAQNSDSYIQLSNDTYKLAYGLGTSEAYLANETIQVQGVEVPNFGFFNTFNVTDQTMGILGVGFTAREATAAQFGFEQPTLMDSLIAQGVVKRRILSLYLNDQDAGVGSMLFGAVDKEKYSGDLVTLAMTPNRTGVYEDYAITLSAVTFNTGTERKLLSPANMTSRTTLDSGTTACFFPKAIADQLIEGFGAIYNAAQAAYFVPCSYRHSKATLEVTFNGPNGPTIIVSMSSLIAPQYQGNTFGDGVPACMFEVSPLSSVAEDTLGTSIMGTALMRAAYIVHDLDNHEISIAQARLNSTTKNIQVVSAGSGGLPGVLSTNTVTATADPIPTAIATTQLVSVDTTATSFPSSPSQPSFSLDVTVAATSSASSTGTAALSGSATGDADRMASWSWLVAFVSALVAGSVVFGV